jgi:thioredoxin-related protein
MKFLLLILMTSSLTTADPVWLTDLNQARSEASHSGKYILVNFSGSDWCGPCIHLHKEIFESVLFKDFAEKNLVLVNADFPRLKKNQLSKEQQKLNEALAEQYDPEGHFPFTVLLDPNGKVVRTWDGFPNEGPDKFIKDINAVTGAVH